MTLWAFNRPFKILGCDDFTSAYYYNKFGRNFPIGGFEDPPHKEKNSKDILITFIKALSSLLIMDSEVKRIVLETV
jgi:hypothetical protein